MPFVGGVNDGHWAWLQVGDWDDQMPSLVQTRTDSPIRRYPELQKKVQIEPGVAESDWQLPLWAPFDGVERVGQ